MIFDCILKIEFSVKIIEARVHIKNSHLMSNMVRFLLPLRGPVLHYDQNRTFKPIKMIKDVL